MKKIYAIALTLIAIILMNSCEDPIGIDKVRKRPVYPPIPLVVIDSVNWRFIEAYGPFNENLVTSSNQFKIVKNIIKLDTSKNYPVIWIELEIENTIPAKYIVERNDRVSSFRLKLDSAVLPVAGIPLNGKINEARWCQIGIEFLGERTKNIFNGDRFFNRIDLKYDHQEGMIYGSFEIILTSLANVETNAFVGFVEMYYK